ncbi:2-hydroxychromene-2-carboxylate isomerase [Marinobacter sp. BGYM27]|uniref:2-hydroxychromene-2-carboxylate isomerase n=1 Tax=Marinobacter sp. BGYM27 TaxID=2975597 RepID=UPI0021A44AF6|nr:2-hydroxychromene-2-carboxylate isomerase [Marinobacter sp. BGYM27]MDG5498412.1 2-hydroxychromene-2-carboxylate isomerase [Marinobacter sp. BGYM27]
MSKRIEFFFDVGSPASYIGWTQIAAIAERNNAELEWKPMLLGAVFQATGNQSPAAVPAKGRYSRMDLQRYAQDYGVTLNFNPFFPVNTLLLMRGAVAYMDTPRFQDYLNAVFTGLWIDELDMGQPEVVAKVLSKAGFDSQEVLVKCNDQATKDKLKAITSEAIERGVFGAPTTFVGDEMFFGQDRLNFAEKALKAD